MQTFTIKEIRRLLNQKGFEPSAADLKRIHTRWATLSVRIKELNEFNFADQEIAPVFNPAALNEEGLNRG
jgi:hypothetical protein